MMKRRSNATKSTSAVSQMAVLLFSLLRCSSAAWHMMQQVTSRTTRTSGTRLSMLSKFDKQNIQFEVPYIVARGDGSTGGGGLPMPNKSGEQEDDDLTRPKVGAAMPKGRPSWFKVPAPSQGMSVCSDAIKYDLACLYHIVFPFF